VVRIPLGLQKSSLFHRVFRVVLGAWSPNVTSVSHSDEGPPIGDMATEPWPKETSNIAVRVLK
jgi:hypothetical protein